MKRVFVFQDSKSRKFWSIEVSGTAFTVNYGKLGTDGQTQTKSFASAEIAQKEANKLVAEKLKKGYVESTENTAKSLKPAAKKYALDYDDNTTDEVLLKKILDDPKLPDIKQLTIGCWSFESGDCQTLIDGLVANREKIAQVEELFWGDIESEETELSWIEQGNMSALIDALPRLSRLIIKGTNNLKLGVKTLPNLRSLEIISGGLPRSVIQDVIASHLPNLEKLVLYAGVEDYGFDGSIEDFKPLFSRAKFPKLTWFGIVNAEEQDALVELALASDLLPQLETLDLSCGVLTDKGGQLLLDNIDKIKHLKFINMRYNYLGKEMRGKLAGLPVRVDVSEANEFEEYDGELYSNPMLTE
ncbi:MAG: STM4015 family protein [Zoogloeaceae bacterium]|jgi:predicted DNA-binding WGR domain protein|nr:STM4015 family protein [Zoogloeaceae bacterium]